MSRIPSEVYAYHQARHEAWEAAEKVDSRPALEALWRALSLYLEPEPLELAIRLLAPWPELAAGYARLAALIYPELASAPAADASMAQPGPASVDLPGWLLPWQAIVAPSVQPRLSVCMIVRDEAATLPACLAALEDLPDEIIVVDTGSTDGTQDLARAHPRVRLSEIQWPEDFAAARNVSLSRASGDWVMVLDADERLTPAGCAYLRRLLAFAPLGWQVYLSQVRQHLDPEGASFAYSLACRLFRRDASLRFSGALHERLIRHSDPPWLLQIALPLRLEHHGNLPAIYARKQKSRRILQLEQLVTDPATANPYLRYQFAFLLVNGIDTAPDHARAEPLLQQALSESLAYAGRLPPRPDWLPADPPAVVLLLARIYASQGRHQEMVALYERFGDACPVTAFVGLAATSYQALGLGPQAQATWLRCFDPGLQPLREPETWQQHALEKLLELALSEQDGLRALWAVRRLRERFPQGRVPGKAYDLGLIQTQLEGLLSLPPGSWLDRCEFEIQQALQRRDIPAVAWHALAYLCESWDQTVLADALRALHLLGAPRLLRRVAALGRCLYPQDPLFASFSEGLRPLSAASAAPAQPGAAPQADERSPLDLAQSAVTGGAYWLQLLQRPLPRPRLSVCMIVRDGADTLPLALASVEAIADEYLIADTGSTDGTQAVIAAWAQSHCVVSWQQPWQDDFAAARNAVLARASGDWILSLDADEQLSPESLAPLGALLAYAPAGLQLFALRILSPQSEELSLRDWVVRVFPRHELIRYWGAFHEQLGHASAPERLPITALEGVTLLHSGYRPEMVARHRKYERQALFASTLRIAGLPNPYFLFHYAYALIYHQQPPDYEQAFALLEQSLSESEAHHHRPPVPGWFAAPTGKVRLLLLRLLAHWQRDHELMARYAAWQGQSEDPEYHYWYATAALRLGELQAAEAGFRRSLRSREPALPQAGFGSWRARLGLAETALRRGDWAMGIEAFQDLIADPGPSAAQQLFSEWWQKMQQRWGAPKASTQAVKPKP